jgi:hypothetical protein
VFPFKRALVTYPETLPVRFPVNSDVLKFAHDDVGFATPTTFPYKMVVSVDVFDRIMLVVLPE